MKFLIIKPAQKQQLTEIIEIDQLCFGGLWSRDAYQKEIASPSSTLLTLSIADSDRFDFKSTQPSNPNRSSSLVQSQQIIKESKQQTHHLIGIGCFWAILEEAHITLVGINPKYQQQGLGQFLFLALLQQAVERKLERATLEVRVSNEAAINLYEKFGFCVAGRRKKYYAKTGEDALILWRAGLREQQFKIDLANWKTEILNRLADNYVLVKPNK